MWAVDAHSERSGLQGEEIFVIAEHLENAGRLLDALLLNPGAEPIEESAQAQLVAAVASVVVHDMESEEVVRFGLLTDSLHEVVELFEIEAASQVDTV